MPGIEKMHLEDALEDAPQTRSLLGVFEKDAMTLRKYTVTMQNICSKILNAQREMCTATQALSIHLKSYEKQNFALEGDNSILSSTLQQFSAYLDEISSLHQILATQLGDSMMYPLNKFIQADLDEVQKMSELYQMSSNDHEQALIRYMKFPKKKEADQKLKQELHHLHHEGSTPEIMYPIISYLIDDSNVAALLWDNRRFNQTDVDGAVSNWTVKCGDNSDMRALHLFSSLNALQYKRKMALLEPLIGYMQAHKGFFDMSKEAIVRPDTDEFLVQCELNEETKNTVELVDNLEKNIGYLYHVDKSAETPFVPPDLTLAQKAGYLFLRSKITLLSTKWERCYFFIQGGNLMCQQKDELAGSLVLDLNQEGTFAEPADVDDRRFTFHVISPKLKKTIILQAENAKEADEWIATINNVVLDGGYVKTDTSKVCIFYWMNNVNNEIDTAVAARSGSTQYLASTPAESGFLPDAPISFDLVTPTDLHKAFQSTKEGPPKRINPFDEAADIVVSENMEECSAFCQTFNVRFLGSMAVRTDRGEQLIHETIRQIMAARAIHNVFKMTESLLIVSNEAMRLVDPATKSIRSEFLLEDISYWAVHKENKRLFGFISRTRSGEEGGHPTFACHVFECNTTGEEICQAIHQATKVAYQVLMSNLGHDIDAVQLQTDKQMHCDTDTLIPENDIPPPE
ncbi:hypothetical protein LSH36_354g02021 [Paralvinella palmiformis]|uniref:DCC-interacting protein 13-alpha n=1 Tax=Paralvinella palmiformis TaxID=53620 RepID=A0AAD9JFD4_9ANNE|nr:hypothetical protein LSH36_354g02021 [Paralvinella palmiformis]